MEINSELVRRTRVDRGWTQQQLAEVADLSLRTVQRVENQSAASNETISSLCAVMEIERQQLLTVDPDQARQQGAFKSARRLLALAVGFGVLVGSSATLGVMWWIGG